MVFLPLGFYPRSCERQPLISTRTSGFAIRRKVTEVAAQIARTVGNSSGDAVSTFRFHLSPPASPRFSRFFAEDSKILCTCTTFSSAQGDWIS
jgi:hypothetical protein